MIARVLSTGCAKRPSAGPPCPSVVGGGQIEERTVLARTSQTLSERGLQKTDVWRHWSPCRLRNECWRRVFDGPSATVAGSSMAMRGRARISFLSSWTGQSARQRPRALIWARFLCPVKHRVTLRRGAVSKGLHPQQATLARSAKEWVVFVCAMWLRGQLDWFCGCCGRAAIHAWSGPDHPRGASSIPDSSKSKMLLGTLRSVGHKKRPKCWSE